MGTRHFQYSYLLINLLLKQSTTWRHPTLVILACTRLVISVTPPTRRRQRTKPLPMRRASRTPMTRTTPRTSAPLATASLPPSPKKTRHSLLADEEAEILAKKDAASGGKGKGGTGRTTGQKD